MPTERVGDTVIKTYRDDLRWQWGREVAFLRKLESVDAPHFPPILELDRYSITTPWLGHTLADPVTYGVPLPAIWDHLHRALCLLERFRIRHRDVTKHNLLWHPERGLTLIDFGWSCWSWEKDTPIPPPEPMHGLYRTDWEQADAAMKELEALRNGG